MTTIYLIRHAQAMGNLERRYQGATNCSLSDLGQSQLEPLALRCRDFPAVHIYASPLTRAMDTAAGANRYLNIPVTALPALTEIHMGEWEGLRYAEVGQRWPEESRAWQENPRLFKAPGGESLEQVYERVTDALAQIAVRHRDETVMVVSHGVSIACALVWAQGGSDYKGDMPLCGNTAISCVTVDGDIPRMVFMNDTGHLTQEIRS